MRRILPEAAPWRETMNRNGRAILERAEGAPASTEDDPVDGEALEGWVLYDAGCGVCSRWVPFWAPSLRRIGLGVRALQDPRVAGELALDPGKLVRDIRLLFADGRHLAGADVYRHVLRRFPWTYPLYLVAAAPLTRRVFDAAYRAFADHRNAISSACGLDPRAR